MADRFEMNEALESWLPGAENARQAAALEQKELVRFQQQLHMAGHDLRP
ncbi:MAG: hypothetical protein II774_06400 [Lachnospiraceae bacterium]|nr:hypothetical protein [Lachnospiraceae bacterium]